MKPVKILGFSGNSAGKESICNAGDPGLIPGSGRSAGERIGYPFQYSWASLVVQKVTNHPAMWKTWVRSLCWEDPLEEGMTTPPVFLPGESPWTEEPRKLQSMGSQRIGHDWATNGTHSCEEYTLIMLTIRKTKCGVYAAVIFFQLFFIFFNFYFYFILLYNTVLVLPYIDMNPPRMYIRSQTWT